MGYPEAINLPFNFDVIKDDFRFVRPGDAEPAEPGLWVILQGSSMVMRATRDGLALHEGEYPAWIHEGPQPVCFGYWQERPLRAIAIGKYQQLPGTYRAEPFNAGGEHLDDRLLTLGGLAQQILSWEKNSAHCSRCSGKMTSIPHTWGKRCTACGREHFPHIHPCIIVLVKRGEEFLLARKAGWPAGRYSLVAGFVDFGESLEECVRREVLEETGIEVGEVRYVGSQNWPFPSQLMAGFVAEYRGGEISIDRTELEDARWFCAEEMPASLPARRSIARWIIERHALGNRL